MPIIVADTYIAYTHTFKCPKCGELITIQHDSEDGQMDSQTECDSCGLNLDLLEFDPEGEGVLFEYDDSEAIPLDEEE